MKYFVALSYEDKNKLKPVITQVKDTLRQNGHTYDVYVDHQSLPTNPKLIMEDATRCLNDCDALFVEMSTKQVGVGIEIGLAKAAHKPIIGIRKIGSEPSTTMEGMLDIPVLEYDSPEDLAEKLPLLLRDVLDLYPEYRIELSTWGQELLDSTTIGVEDIISRLELPSKYTSSIDAMTILRKYIQIEIITGFGFQLRKLMDSDLKGKGFKKDQDTDLLLDKFNDVLNTENWLNDQAKYTLAYSDLTSSDSRDLRQLVFNEIWKDGETSRDRDGLFALTNEGKPMLPTIDLSLGIDHKINTR